MPSNRFSKLPRRLTFERILSGYNGLTNPCLVHKGSESYTWKCTKKGAQGMGMRISQDRTAHYKHNRVTMSLNNVLISINFN